MQCAHRVSNLCDDQVFWGSSFHLSFPDYRVWHILSVAHRLGDRHPLLKVSTWLAAILIRANMRRVQCDASKRTSPTPVSVIKRRIGKRSSWSGLLQVMMLHWHWLSNCSAHSWEGTWWTRWMQGFWVLPIGEWYKVCEVNQSRARERESFEIELPSCFRANAAWIVSGSDGLASGNRRQM